MIIRIAYNSAEHEGDTVFLHGKKNEYVSLSTEEFLIGIGEPTRIKVMTKTFPGALKLKRGDEDYWTSPGDDNWGIFLLCRFGLKRMLKLTRLPSTLYFKVIA